MLYLLASEKICRHFAQVCSWEYIWQEVSLLLTSLLSTRLLTEPIIAQFLYSSIYHQALILDWFKTDTIVALVIGN